MAAFKRSPQSKQQLKSLFAVIFMPAFRPLADTQGKWSSLNQLAFLFPSQVLLKALQDGQIGSKDGSEGDGSDCALVKGFGCLAPLRKLAVFIFAPTVLQSVVQQHSCDLVLCREEGTLQFLRPYWGASLKQLTHGISCLLVGFQALHGAVDDAADGPVAVGGAAVLRVTGERLLPRRTLASHGTSGVICRLWGPMRLDLAPC